MGRFRVILALLLQRCLQLSGQGCTGSDALNCRCVGADGHAIIPASVSAIPDRAFYGCAKLRQVSLSNVVSIGNQSFFRTNLVVVNIPSSVVSIGFKAFADIGSLSEVAMPNSVTSIGRHAFSGTALKSMVIPSSITSIPEGIFEQCWDLRNVTIPSSVVSIGLSAFRGCKELKSVSIPDAVTSIETSTFRDCSSLVNVSMPKNLTVIGSYAFDGCRALPSISIPDLVTSIERSTFRGCRSLVDVSMPKNLTRIASSAFDGCRSLASMSIPNSVKTIGDQAFYRCSSLPSLIIPDSVNHIGVAAFKNCSLLSQVTLPEHVNFSIIAKEAFSHCASLESVKIPETVKTIDESAFSYCKKLSSVRIPRSVIKIGGSAFLGTALSGKERYEVLDSVEIGALAFPSTTTTRGPTTITTVSVTTTSTYTTTTTRTTTTAALGIVILDTKPLVSPTTITTMRCDDRYIGKSSASNSSSTDDCSSTIETAQIAIALFAAAFVVSAVRPAATGGTTPDETHKDIEANIPCPFATSVSGLYVFEEPCADKVSKCTCKVGGKAARYLLVNPKKIPMDYFWLGCRFATAGALPPPPDRNIKILKLGRCLANVLQIISMVPFVWEISVFILGLVHPSEYILQKENRHWEADANDSRVIQLVDRAHIFYADYAQEGSSDVSLLARAFLVPKFVARSIRQQAVLVISMLLSIYSYHELGVLEFAEAFVGLAVATLVCSINWGCLLKQLDIGQGECCRSVFSVFAAVSAIGIAVGKFYVATAIWRIDVKVIDQFLRFMVLATLAVDCLQLVLHALAAQVKVLEKIADLVHAFTCFLSLVAFGIATVAFVTLTVVPFMPIALSALCFAEKMVENYKKELQEIIENYENYENLQMKSQDGTFSHGSTWNSFGKHVWKTSFGKQPITLFRNLVGVLARQGYYRKGLVAMNIFLKDLRGQDVDELKSAFLNKAEFKEDGGPRLTDDVVTKLLLAVGVPVTPERIQEDLENQTSDSRGVGEPREPRAPDRWRPRPLSPDQSDGTAMPSKPLSPVLLGTPASQAWPKTPPTRTAESFLESANSGSLTPENPKARWSRPNATSNPSTPEAIIKQPMPPPENLRAAACVEALEVEQSYFGRRQRGGAIPPPCELPRTLLPGTPDHEESRTPRCDEQLIIDSSLQPDQAKARHGEVVQLVQADGHPSVRIFDTPERQYAEVIGELPSGFQGIALDRSNVVNSCILVRCGAIEGWIGKKNVLPLKDEPRQGSKEPTRKTPPSRQGITESKPSSRTGSKRHTLGRQHTSTSSKA